MSQSSGRQSRTYSVVVIEPRQVPQQVADVGADAVVAQLARVDGDAHVGGILSAGLGRPGRRRLWRERIRFRRRSPIAVSILPHLRRSRRYEPQQRRPARMVLLVERELAAAVGRVHRVRRGRAGAAAQVDDLGRRREQDPPAARADARRRSRRPRCRGSSARRAGPTASASRRRTSRQAPLTQSTNCSRRVARSTQRDDRRRRRARTSAIAAFCRSSLSGEIIGPNDSSARPSASTSRGPATAAAGTAISAPHRRSIAPGGTIVSLFSSRTARRAVARMPALFAGANPTFAAARSAGPSGQPRAHRGHAAVGRGVVDDDDLVRRSPAARRSATRGSFSRSARALKLTMTIESVIAPAILSRCASVRAAVSSHE